MRHWQYSCRVLSLYHHISRVCAGALQASCALASPSVHSSSITVCPSGKSCLTMVGKDPLPAKRGLRSTHALQTSGTVAMPCQNDRHPQITCPNLVPQKAGSWKTLRRRVPWWWGGGARLHSGVGASHRCDDGDLACERQPPQVAPIRHIHLLPGGCDEHHADVLVLQQIRSIRPVILFIVDHLVLHLALLQVRCSAPGGDDTKAQLLQSQEHHMSADGPSDHASNVFR